MSASAGAAGRVERAAPRRGVTWARRLRYYLPAVLVFAGGIIGWEVVVTALGLQGFVLPRPSAIVVALFENLNSTRFGLLPSARATLIEALGGLAIGTVSGLIVALATARWATARGLLLPVAVAANAVPIIAFAPIFNNWFGTDNQFSKAMIAAVLVFFPVMINTLRGLLNVDPSALELLRSYAAPERTVFRSLRVPNSLPFIFTSLRVATTLATIGAIVSEYFAAPRGSLGQYIATQSAFLAFERSWAAIIFAAAIGIGLYLLVVILERVVSPWARAQALAEH
jgi:NitT/TauT family transport system permease protein